MAAFTRIAHEPIRERGPIMQPDLVVVADNTLLTDPAAQPLAGCDSDCTVVMNSTSDATTLQSTTAHQGRLLVMDFTALALEITRTLASLSTALGMATAHLAGLSLADILAGLEEELGQTHLSPPQHAANLALARTVHARVSAWVPMQERVRDTAMVAPALADVSFDPPRRAAPSIYAIGNSPERKTGSWRDMRPSQQLRADAQDPGRSSPLSAGAPLGRRAPIPPRSYAFPPGKVWWGRLIGSVAVGPYRYGKCWSRARWQEYTGAI